MTCQNHLPANLAYQSPTTTVITDIPPVLVLSTGKEIMNIENLKKGIQLWHTHPTWATDFHGQLYLDLQKLFEPELTTANWAKMVDILWAWRAIRPCTKQYIYDRGVTVLPKINLLRQGLLQRQPPSWEQYEWSELAPFFKTIGSIKNATSPVFASKMAHFCLPKVFPVIDREFIGVKESYDSYWQRCRQLWQAAAPDFQKQAQTVLKEFLTPAKQINYPWATKITELCLSAVPKENKGD